METMKEFEEIILNKLDSIEERLSNIETVLGILPLPSETDITEETSEEIIESQEETTENLFNSEIADLQAKLADIKSLFSITES